MEKKFDAVEMVRKIRDKHYEEIKNKSYKEKMELYRKRASGILNAKESSTVYGVSKV